jgi:hypothetical protein
MKTRVFFLAFASILLLSFQVFGHHSFAVTYELDLHKTIEGTIKSFTVRNPHSFLTIEVQDQEGKLQVWGVEWAGTSALNSAGISSATLKIGDKVVITGAPSKDQNEQKMLMQRIVRTADKWTWEGTIGRFRSSNTPLPPVEGR